VVDAVQYEDFHDFFSRQRVTRTRLRRVTRVAFA
jgi:hypothetical protein